MKAALIPLILALSSMSWANTKIEVFTNDRFPVQQGQYQTTYYNLDDRDRANSSFPQNLPADPDEAKAILSQFMQSSEFQKTKAALKSAYEGYVATQSYKLEKLPAMVINEKYILYGINDVSYAMRIYEDFERGLK